MNHNRMQRLTEQVLAQGADGIALMPGPNMLYLSGIHMSVSERPALLFVPADASRLRQVLRAFFPALCPSAGAAAGELRDKAAKRPGRAARLFVLVAPRRRPHPLRWGASPVERVAAALEPRRQTLFQADRVFQLRPHPALEAGQGDLVEHLGDARVERAGVAEVDL